MDGVSKGWERLQSRLNERQSSLNTMEGIGTEFAQKTGQLQNWSQDFHNRLDSLGPVSPYPDKQNIQADEMIVSCDCEVFILLTLVLGDEIFNGKVHKHFYERNLCIVILQFITSQFYTQNIDVTIESLSCKNVCFQPHCLPVAKPPRQNTELVQIHMRFMQSWQRFRFTDIFDSHATMLKSNVIFVCCHEIAHSMDS